MSFLMGANTATYVDLPSELTVDWEVDEPVNLVRLRMGGTYGLELAASIAALRTLISALTEACEAMQGTGD